MASAIDPEHVEERAAAGDADAMFQLANWRVFGRHGPRDLAGAYRLLAKASEAGHVPSTRLWAYFTANGTGCAPDPAAAAAILRRIADADAYSAMQIEALRRMPAEAQIEALPREKLSADPRVEIVRGLFSTDECRYLTMLGGPRLEASMVVDPVTGGKIPHPIRTSDGTNFPRWREDLVVNAINRRIALATGTDPAAGEALHLLRYRPGEQYRLHLDAVPGIANPRAVTAICYLNDGYEGGETVFPDLKLKVRGRTGDCLIFANLTEDGRPDERTKHAGLPVSQGEKWLATRWIRRGPYDPVGDSQ